MKIFSKNFHKILTNKETCEPVLQNVPEDAVQIILQNNQSIAEEVEKSDYVQNSIARLAARKSGNVKAKVRMTSNAYRAERENADKVRSIKSH